MNSSEALSQLSPHARLQIRGLIRTARPESELYALVRDATPADLIAEASAQFAEVEQELGGAELWGPERHDELYRLTRLHARKYRLGRYLKSDRTSAQARSDYHQHYLRTRVQTLCPRYLAHAIQAADVQPAARSRATAAIRAAVAELSTPLTDAQVLRHPAAADHRRCQVELDSLHRLREFAGREDFLADRIRGLEADQAEAKHRAAAEAARWLTGILTRLDEQDLTALTEVLTELESHPSHYPPAAARQLRRQVGQALAAEGPYPWTGLSQPWPDPQEGQADQPDWS